MKWMTTMMMMIRVKMVKLAATNAAHHSNSLIYSFHLLNQGGSHPPWLNLVWWSWWWWRQTTYKLNNDDDFIPVLPLIAINEQRIFVSFWPSTWSEHKRCQPGYHQCCSRYLTRVDPFKPSIFFLQLLFQFSLWFWQTISSVLWWVWW